MRMLVLLVCSSPLFADITVPRSGDLDKWKTPWVAACALRLEEAGKALVATGLFQNPHVGPHYPGADFNHPMPKMYVVSAKGSFSVDVQSYPNPATSFDWLTRHEQHGPIDALTWLKRRHGRSMHADALNADAALAERFRRIILPALDACLE
jgi:hypothetical protein